MAQIPLHTLARRELQQTILGKAPEERVLPISASGADLLLQSGANVAHFPEKGILVSHHDLRRTFGRIAHEAGMDLVQLKNLFGHSSLDMTVHYIGLDVQRMREGLNLLDDVLKDSEVPTRRPKA